MSTTFYDGQGNTITIDSGGGGGDGSIPTSVNKLLSFYDWPEYYGFLSKDSGKWTNVNLPSNYKFKVIPVNGGEKIEIYGWKTGKVSVLKSFSPPVQGAAAPEPATDTEYNCTFAKVNGWGTLPSDARYLIVLFLYNGAEMYPYTLKLNGHDYMCSVKDQLEDQCFKNNVNWMNFGDSITCGYISWIADKANDIAVSCDNRYSLCWSYLVSKINNWNYTRKGLGGQGWINGNNAIFNHVRSVEDYSPYNLITFAVGINDWKGQWPLAYGDVSDPYTYSDNLTPTTVVESMRFCFDYILSRNPNIKIIVISPFNCRGYKSKGTHPYGSYETSWARGHKRYQGNTKGVDDFATIATSTKLTRDQASDAVHAYVNGDTETFDEYAALAEQKGGCNRDEFIALVMWAYNRAKTLDEFVDITKAVCDLYGIEMIDMTRNSVINRDNLIDLLPDGVHPSVKCHRLLARELSKKLSFNLGSTVLWRKDYTGGLVVSDQSITMENGTTVTVSVYLDTKPENGVVVTATTTDESLLDAVPMCREFDPSDYSSAKTFSFTATEAGSYNIYIGVPETPNDLVVTIPVTVTEASS